GAADAAPSAGRRAGERRDAAVAVGGGSGSRRVSGGRARRRMVRAAQARRVTEPRVPRPFAQGRPWDVRRSDVDGDVLGLQELVDTDRAAFAAEAGLLHAT